MRYLQKQIEKDLTSKMVFVAGPRQVGKTTLAQSLMKSSDLYLNWDIPQQRDRILKRELPHDGLIVFDEIHKYRQWRNYLKGLYDERKSQNRFLVTGSAKLDYYRFGGDSLQGRYHHLRMHPLSFAELKMTTAKELEMLFQLSGFPEPFFKSVRTEADRWSIEYRSRVLQEDVNSLEQVKDLGQMELMMIRLPELVGSPLSINAIREDLQLNHQTVARWLEIFERLYCVFRLSPFGSVKIKAVKKEQKHYHFDWNVVKDPGGRFENLVACHLLKWVHFLHDTQGRDMELRYFRDVNKREVDFVVTENRKPMMFVECKLDDGQIADGLRYLNSKFPKVPAWQISLFGKKDYLSKEGVRVCPASELLRDLV